MRCSYQTPGGSWACSNKNAHLGPPSRYPPQLDSTQQVPCVATPIRLPHCTPRAQDLLCNAIGRLQFIHEGSWFIYLFFLARCSGDAVGQRPCFSIFMMTCFGKNPNWAFFLSALKCDGILSVSIITHHLVLQFGFHLGVQTKRVSLCFSTYTWLTSNAAQIKWLDCCQNK